MSEYIKKDNPYREKIDKLKEKVWKDRGTPSLTPAGQKAHDQLKELRKKAREWENKNTSYMTGKRLKK